MIKSLFVKALAVSLASSVWAGSISVQSLAAQVHYTASAVNEFNKDDTNPNISEPLPADDSVSEEAVSDSLDSGAGFSSDSETAADPTPETDSSSEAALVPEAETGSSPEAETASTTAPEAETTSTTAPEAEATDTTAPEAETASADSSDNSDLPADDSGSDPLPLTPENGTSPSGSPSGSASAQAAEEQIAESDESKNSAASGPSESSGLLSDISVVFVGGNNPIVIPEGTKTALTAKVTFTAKNCQIEDLAVDSVNWSTSSSKSAAIKVQDPVITEKPITEDAVETAAEPLAVTPTETAPAETAAPSHISEFTITQTATVTAVKEGKATITVTAGGMTCAKEVTVNPVPVQLGKSTNLRWTGTAVLHWDAVKNTDKYRITVCVSSGADKYRKSTIVQGKLTCRLEDTIVALVKKYLASANGASYTVYAAVQALTKDSLHYTDGPIVHSPVFRYMKSTYKDSVSRNGWYIMDDGWYFYSGGKKQTGWITFLAKRYYLDKDGRMLTNRWVGSRYVKSGGEMARNEWVDGYKYYVDDKGLRVDDASLSTKRWVKTAKGWRFKRVNGQYARNIWLPINKTKYYFDSDGYLKTGWLSLQSKKYFLTDKGTIASGLGIPKTGWAKIGNNYFWFDDNGVMAKNQWVDRKQYYVNSAGRRASWISYDGLKNVSTTNRLGQYVYSSSAAPEQSIAGYDKAYKSGNRIMVIDLRYTKDGVPVCFHDDVIKYARRPDGSVPSDYPSISRLTYNELNQYDYGIKWGQQYKGTKAMTLEAMAKWIKEHPDTEMYVEVKTDQLSDAQIKKAVSILNKYGITGRSSVLIPTSKSSSVDTRASRLHKAAPSLRIGIFKYGVSSALYSQFKSAKGPLNNVFYWCWYKTEFDSAVVSKLRSMDVQYESGTLDKFEDIIAYYARGSAYSYVSSIETEGAVFFNTLKKVTLHNKAKWVNADGGRKYLQIDGTYARNKWVEIGGKYYHFDKNGLMQTGWQTIGGKRYYMDSQGVRIKGPLD